LDLKKILGVMRKMYSTNGTIKRDKESGDVIQMQGDLRKEVSEFLVKYKICTRDEIKVHGF
jgi:translation initiation factor 1